MHGKRQRTTLLHEMMLPHELVSSLYHYGKPDLFELLTGRPEDDESGNLYVRSLFAWMFEPLNPRRFNFIRSP